ncbi:MAG: DNA gyrase modulator, partial [Acholeplasmataceae bacterium]
MIEKNKLQSLIEAGMETGADFVEIFLEDTHQSVIRITSHEITNVDRLNTYGAGIRLLLDLDEVYGYTNDTSYEGLLSLIKNLRSS